MLPVGHLAVGYLLASGYIHARYREPPDAVAVFFVAAGALLPDLIDKPLELAGILPGRSLGHSYLFAVPVVLLVGLAYRRWSGGRFPAAFALSYLAHPFADGYSYFLKGTLYKDFLEVSFWVWPFSFPANAIVTTLSGYGLTAPLVAQKVAWTAQHLPSEGSLQAPLRIFEFCLVVLAAVLWVVDGMPGWGTFRGRIRRLLPR